MCVHLQIPVHVLELGINSNVYVLHIRKLWISRDERHEREQADGSAQRIRVRSDVRGQGRRLDARRRCPMGVSAACLTLHMHNAPFVLLISVT